MSSDVPELSLDMEVRLAGDPRRFRVYRAWPLIAGKEPMVVSLLPIYDEEASEPAAVLRGNA